MIHAFTRSTSPQTARVVVIGAGIGGLTTAALLANAGYAVTVLEAGTYPGGSAGTFFHQGYRYEAGATLAGGFHPNGPHAVVAERLGLTWPVRPSDPAWTVHLPDRRITLGLDGGDVQQHFPQSERFWDAQRRAADAAWALAARGLPWPPSSVGEAVQLLSAGIAGLPGDLRVLPLAFRTARQWLAQYGLADDAAFLRFVDAQLLISAQTTSAYANALYSATALDLPRQGVNHVEGGIGSLARTLADAVTARGGQILYKHHVTGIELEAGRVARVHALKQGRKPAQFACNFAVANLTPWSLDELLGDASPRSLRREVLSRKPGWGAFVLYLGVKEASLPHGLADHHQIVTEMEGPLGEGRSIFVSFSPLWDKTRAPEGFRAVTVTTHTAVGPWWDLVASDPAAYEARKEEYMQRMLAGIEAAIPGFRGAIDRVMTGTPVTYANWTHRNRGMVGGFPQVSLFDARGPWTGVPNLRLVGDSIFPGQSTAGVTVGAMRVAADVLRRLPRSSARSYIQVSASGSPQQ